jgi:NTE family protein
MLLTSWRKYLYRPLRPLWRWQAIDFTFLFLTAIFFSFFCLGIKVLRRTGSSKGTMIRGYGLILLCFFSLSGLAQSQRVGLVFSGGAAKGIAHLGVLKALEENEVPIDYVVGTSMGGIVAGCYSAGMSPDEIEEMMLSEAFQRWVNGNLEEGYNYYYNKTEDRPSFLKLNLSLDSSFNVFINTSIANDLSLNFALTEKLAQPSAIANNNFDSLFVPLRVIASDIFTQTEVVLKKGSLGDAIRATQTAPFFYSPIRVDGKYLFDGGVYNNFPIDVAEKEFHPDIIIGSNVSSKVYDEYPYGEDEKLISRSLLYMLLDKSDPNKVPASGIYIQPNLKNFTAFDFGKVKSLIDSGYAQTMRQMADIKSKIKNSRSCEEVNIVRNRFRNKTKPLIAEHILFKDFNSRQQRYLNHFFKKGKRPLYFSDIKSGYYRLVSDDYFKNVFPEYIYDSTRRSFDFQLSRRPQNNFQVDFGGVIATRDISNIFLGLNYYRFQRALIHTQANFNAGDFYKSADIKVRVDYPNFGQFYIEPETVFNSWNFLEGKDIINKKYIPTVLTRIDRKLGLSVGIPIGKQYKASINGAYISNTDQYVDTNTFTSSDTLDLLKLYGSRVGVSVSTKTLNRKQYASEGKSYQFSIDYFNLREDLKPGTTSEQMVETVNQRKWFRARVLLEQYFRKGIYSSGYYFDGVISNQPVFSNYFGTIINATGFNPIQDSRTLLLQNFRAFNYLAGGWRNVFRIRKNLDFRLEGYLFKPYQIIGNGPNQQASLSRDFTSIFFAGTAGLVMHSTVGPISLSVNYYDDKESQLGILLHVGFLLFNKTSLE